MSCRFHQAEATSGQCFECHSDYCDDCAVPIVRHGMLCLDCGAKFAGKKLRMAYLATALGAVAGIMVGAQAGFWYMLPAILFYSYAFGGFYFGYHYGGTLWVQMGKLADKCTGAAGFAVAILFLSVRLGTALILGMFGGGVVQFLRYRKLIGYHRGLMPLETATAATEVSRAG